ALIALRGHVAASFVTWAFGVAASAALVVATSAEDWAFDGGSVNVIVFAGVSGATLALATLVAQREAVRVQLRVERGISASEQSRRLLVEERNRIARELHDVVAHSMSVIHVQATTAPYRLPDMDESTRTE